MEIEPIDYAKFEGRTPGDWREGEELTYVRQDYETTPDDESDGLGEPYSITALVIGAGTRENVAEIPGTDAEDAINTLLIAAAPYHLDQLRARDARIKELEDHLHNLRMEYGDVVQGI